MNTIIKLLRRGYELLVASGNLLQSPLLLVLRVYFFLAALYDWPRSSRKYRKSIRIFREPWHPVPDSERLPLKFGGMFREPAIDYRTCFAPHGDPSGGHNGRGLSRQLI